MGVNNCPKCTSILTRTDFNNGKCWKCGVSIKELDLSHSNVSEIDHTVIGQRGGNLGDKVTSLGSITSILQIIIILVWIGNISFFVSITDDVNKLPNSLQMSLFGFEVITFIITLLTFIFLGILRGVIKSIYHSLNKK